MLSLVEVSHVAINRFSFIRLEQTRMSDAAEVQRPLRRADWNIEPRREVSLADGRKVTLRPLEPQDAEAVAKFFSSLTKDDIHYFFELDKDAARKLALEVEEATAFRLVAVDESREEREILGYMFMEWRGEKYPEAGACFSPGAQSGGLSRPMATHLIQSTAASGVRRMYATVHPDNQRSLRLIQRTGLTLVNEFINEHQGIKQYRMEMDLPPRHIPPIVDDLVIVPQGGIGVGMAAARVQSAVEAFTGARPLLLNLPPKRDGSAIFVSELSSNPRTAHKSSSPSLSPPNDASGWIVGLDDKHLLIGGIDVEAVDSAARRYEQSLTSNSDRVDSVTHVYSSEINRIPLLESYMTTAPEVRGEASTQR